MMRSRPKEVAVSFRSWRRAWAICLLLLVWFSRLAVPASGEGISGDLQVEGNRFFSGERLLAEMRLKPRSPFSLQLVENGIERMLSLYEDNGFPYCRISPGDFRVLEDGLVSFSCRVEEGPRVRITQIQLEGLRSTRKEVILREMRAGVFGLFSQSRLDAGLKRVEQLSFIEGVEDVRLLAGDNPEEGKINIRLRERKNNSVEGVLGYAPRGGDGKGNLFGSLNIYFDNIFGTGRMMRWSWSKKDPHSSHLLFSYREPWVLGFPPTLELSLEQVDQDSTYLKLSASTKITFSAARDVSWDLTGGWEKVVPGPAGEEQIPDSRKYTAGAGLALDLVDQSKNPQQGISYRTELIMGRKRNYPTASLGSQPESVSSLKLNLDLDHFLPVVRTHTFFVGIHLRELFTGEKPVPLSDQFELGGAGSIRGYREGEFLGTQVAWTNLEYRFLLKDDSRLHLFLDYGHFGRLARTGEELTLRQISGEWWGYGIGLRLNSKAGLLGLDYGLGEGDSINHGKIHLRLVSRF